MYSPGKVTEDAVMNYQSPQMLFAEIVPALTPLSDINFGRSNWVSIEESSLAECCAFECPHDWK